MPRSIEQAKIMWGSSFNVQKKGTPCKNPRNNGGSPIGVKTPPILLTKKIKKTTV